MDANVAKKIMTLCLILRRNEVLLGMKKRGFGAGRWNGYGGKVEAGETVEDAARRETKEESGVELIDLEKIGALDFEFQGKAGILEVNIFRATEFAGLPVETEEMKPQWFKIDALPFGEMWPDDRYWMPLFFAGKKFVGRFLFGEGDAILEKELKEVDSI